LYIPEIQRVQQTIGVGGKTYIGDCKMGALATRAWIAQGGDYYWCPLAGQPMPAETLEALLAPVFCGEQTLEPVFDPEADPTAPPERLAEGYAVLVEIAETVDGHRVTWPERRWVVRSIAQAAQQSQRLDDRLQKALAAIERLNERKQGKKILDAEGLNTAAQAILQQQRVGGLVNLHVETTTESFHRRAYRGRPAGTLIKEHSTLTAQIDPAAVQAARERLGWRVYATNHVQLPLTTIIQAYRGQSVIEQAFRRLKGRTLSLTPLFLQTETRVIGLIRLLSLALRLLVLVEFVVRRQLAHTDGQVAGLYPGQATRATATPTAELILRAFRGISLTVVAIAGQIRTLLSPLSGLQQRLLELLGASTHLYERLIEHFQEPAFNLSEP
jgi:transposase